MRQERSTSTHDSIDEETASDADGSEHALSAAEIAAREQVEHTLRRSLRDLRRAQEELKGSEAQLQTITDALPALVSYVDAGERYRFSNVAYEAWFAQPKSDIIGKHMRDVLGPEAYEQLRPHVSAALAGETVKFQERIPYASGERHIDATYIPDRDVDGTVRGFVVLVTDISERRRFEDARDAIADRTERLMLITAAIADAVTAEQVQEAIVDDIAVALGAASAALWTVDDGRHVAVLRRSVGYADAAKPQLDGLPLDVEGRLPVLDAIRAGKPLWIASQQDLLERYPHLEPLVTVGRKYSIACLPIIVHARTLGALALTFEGQSGLDADARKFLQVVARYAGQALERLRLLEAERLSRARAEASAARMTALSHASRAFAECAADLDVLLDTIAAEVTIAYADACAVMLVDEAGEHLVVGAVRHRDPEASRTLRAAIASAPLNVGEGGMGRVAESGETVLLPVVDPERVIDDGHPSLRAWVREHMPHSILIAPMRARGRILGVIAANRESASPISFDVDDQRFLEELGERAAMAIESTRLSRDNQEARVRAEILYGLARSVLNARNLDEVYGAALEGIERAHGTTRASVLAFDDGGVMRFVAWRGLSEDYRRALDGHSPWPRDARDPDAILVGDVAKDPSMAPYREVLAAERIAALAFVPLVAEGRLLGKLTVYYDRPRRFASAEREIALAVAHHVAAAIARFAAVASLEQSVRWSEMFTGILGHDLRNPLGAIMTAAQLAMTRDASEKSIKPLARIMTSGQRMARMIDQLLDFTRMRVGGGIPLQPRKVELAMLLRQALDELEDAHPECALQLHAIGDTIGVWDEDRLMQVFSNLVGNAVQHGVAAHGVHVRVDGSDSALVRVEVHNRGAVPVDLLPKLFDPMTGGDRRRSKSMGLGLGLFITRQITLAHGGRVDVTSTEDDGTMFTVALPRITQAGGIVREQGRY